MAMALDLARLGLGRTSPNPAVGAVIVKNGKVIATGFHKKAGLPHAEIEALRNVGARFSRPGGRTPPLQNTTLYVTLEPCCPPKAGRTPPCTDAIIRSGIKEVVIGMRDPDPKVSGRGVRILKKHGIRVREGILRRECEALNEGYVKHRKTGLPFVILKAAATLDGMVAIKGTGTARRARTRWITGPEARAQGHRIRDQVDGILVGINTVMKDNPRLTTRLPGKKGRDPVRIILDSSLRLKPKANVLKVLSSSPAWIATSAKKNHPKVRLLEKKGTEILFGRATSGGRIDLKWLLRELGKRGIVNLLVEGGPAVYSSFFKERLVDKMILFLAPSFLGEKGIPIFPAIGVRGVPTLKGLTARMIDRDLMIEGYL